jgi:acetoacetate decarboxylase
MAFNTLNKIIPNIVELIGSVNSKSIINGSVISFYYQNTSSIDEILYLKASSAYTEIYLNKGHCIIASRTLKSFEEALENPFVRVHNSYIVNMNFIKNFDKSDAILYLENGQSIAVSKSKKDQLLKAVYKTF